MTKIIHLFFKHPVLIFKCIIFFVYRFGNAGGGPAGGLDGRLGGGPPGGPRPPGKGGGALLVGGAGISLIGVEGAELAVLAEPLAELETLSLKTQYIY